MDINNDQPAFRLPQLRVRRCFRAAAYFAAWGVGGLVSTTVPGLAANRDHVMLYYIFLVVAVLLMLLAVAAQDLPLAETAAARLEEWITTLFYNPH